MDPILKAYLREWLDWVERGAPQNQPFSRSHGLCNNVCGSSAQDKTHLEHQLGHALETSFPEDKDYPFGYCAYLVRGSAGTMHEDPKRLAWVREMLTEPTYSPTYEAE